MTAERTIRLAHGNGGRLMRQLIRDVFEKHLRNPDLDVTTDAAPLPTPEGTPYVTSDGFTVQPLEFPGGDIGSLAVNGTINDLAVAGATPRYLTLSAIIEEGLETSQLDRIIASAGRAARAAAVRVIAGDTKVVPRGQGGGLYLTATGIGVRCSNHGLGLSKIRPGDLIVASGTLGDHGAAVMLAREEFGLEGSDLRSDCGSVLELTRALPNHGGLRFMRDPTRGGIATVANEIARAIACEVRLWEAELPLRDDVCSLCEILGLEAYYLASEGRVIAVVAPEVAAEVVAAWRRLESGRNAAVVGEISKGPARVVLETRASGHRLLHELEDDPLPRIC
jgi:hydrogenase expression/formation protein HypE